MSDSIYSGGNSPMIKPERLKSQANITVIQFQ